MIRMLKNNPSSGSLPLVLLTAPLSVTGVTKVVSGHGQGQGGLCLGRGRGRSSANPRSRERGKVGRASSPAELLSSARTGRSDCFGDS